MPAVELDELVKTYRARIRGVGLRLPEIERILPPPAPPETPAAVPPSPPESPAPAVAPPKPPPQAPPEPPPPSARAEPLPVRSRPPTGSSSLAERAQPAAAPPARRLRAAACTAACLAALLLAGLGHWQHRRGLAALRHRFHPTAQASSAGLAVAGDILLCADPVRRLLLGYSLESAEPRAVRKLANPGVFGFASARGRLWSTQPDAGRVYVHAPDPSAVERVFSNLYQAPSAMAWDGTSLWIADARTRTLTRYSTGELLQPAQQYTLPGTEPVGLHVEGRRLWVLDGPGRRLDRYRVAALLQPEDQADLRPWLGEARPTGLALAGEAVWVAADGPTGLHRFEARLLPWRPARPE